LRYTLLAVIRSPVSCAADTKHVMLPRGVYLLANAAILPRHAMILETLHSVEEKHA